MARMHRATRKGAAMRYFRWVLATVVLGSASAALALEGDGLKVSADALPWSHWQGRLSMAVPGWRAGLAVPEQGLKVDGMSLMADYYFRAEPRAAGSSEGFRATSGVLVGPRAQFLGNQVPGSGAFGLGRRVFGTATGRYAPDSGEASAVPYIGIGYTGLAGRSGWSFSADLGLMSLRPGSAIRFGRVANGSQSLDDMVREMRLSPVLQVGVSYAF
jgi:hypothetical protein